MHTKGVIERSPWLLALGLVLGVVIAPLGVLLWTAGFLLTLCGIIVAACGLKAWSTIQTWVSGGLVVRGCGVVVTGGSAGIGAAIAKRLAASGARVVVWGRNRARLASVVEEITSSGGTAWYVVCDVGKRASIAEAAEVSRKRLGGVVDIVAGRASARWNAGGS